MSHSPLIPTSDASGLIGEPGVVFADTRWYLGEPDLGPAAYAEEHIPGAIYIDLETDLSSRLGPGRHPLPDRAGFASRMGSLGIGDDSLVIAYDDRSGAIAARLWWMLRWIGHSNVRVLDGGLAAWRDEGRATSTENPDVHSALLTVEEPLTTQIDRTALAPRLGSVRVFDARAPERYRGDEEPIDPIGGHVPTALNRPYEATLASDGRLLPAADLRTQFGDSDEETIVYCGSGVTACHDIMAMVVAGLPEPTLYPGSWSDWSSSEMRIATGPEPGA